MPWPWRETFKSLRVTSVPPSNPNDVDGTIVAEQSITSGPLVAQSITVLASGPYTPATGAPAGTVVTSVDPYNVRAYGVRADGVTDDTAAWYNGSTGVLDKIPASGGRVDFPPGVSIISSSIKPKTKTIIQGHGRNTSIFKSTSGFASSDIGVIEYTGTILFAELRNVGFDLTSSTNDVFSAVHQIAGSMQHFIADDCFGDLTGGGAVGHQFFFFESLGSTTAGSFDLSFNNIYGHNGSGTVQLYSNANGITSVVRNIAIRNIFDYVDTPVGDDRIAIIGNAFGGATNCEVRDILIDGHFIQIAAGVASGTVNAVKFDTGGGVSGTYIHNFAVRNIFHRNLSPVNVLGAPISFFWTTPGFIQDYVIDTVHASGTSRIKTFLVRKDAAPMASLRNIRMYNCWDASFGIEMVMTATPAGDEIVDIGPFNIVGTATLGTSAPVGIGFVGLPVAAGGSGSIWVHDGMVEGMRGGVTNMVNEAGAVVTSAWTNIKIYRVNGNSVTQAFTNMMGTFRLEDCPGLGPSGDFGQFWGAFPASPGTITNSKGRDATVILHTGVGVTVSVIALNGATITGLTMVASSLQILRLPANGTITLTYAGGTPTYNVFCET